MLMLLLLLCALMCFMPYALKMKIMEMFSCCVVGVSVWRQAQWLGVFGLWRCLYLHESVGRTFDRFLSYLYHFVVACVDSEEDPSFSGGVILERVRKNSVDTEEDPSFSGDVRLKRVRKNSVDTEEDPSFSGGVILERVRKKKRSNKKKSSKARVEWVKPKRSRTFVASSQISRNEVQQIEVSYGRFKSLIEPEPITDKFVIKKKKKKLVNKKTSMNNARTTENPKKRARKIISNSRIVENGTKITRNSYREAISANSFLQINIVGLFLLFLSMITLIRLDIVGSVFLLPLYSMFKLFNRRAHLKRSQRLWYWQMSRRHGFDLNLRVGKKWGRKFRFTPDWSDLLNENKKVVDPLSDDPNEVLEDPRYNTTNDEQNKVDGWCNEAGEAKNGTVEAAGHSNINSVDSAKYSANSAFRLRGGGRNSARKHRETGSNKGQRKIENRGRKKNVTEFSDSDEANNSSQDETSLNDIEDMEVDQFPQEKAPKNQQQLMEVEIPHENIFEKTLTLQTVLGDKYTSLYYMLSCKNPQMTVDQIPEIGTDSKIIGEFITFALADYIKQDIRAIALYSFDFFVNIDTAKNPMEFLVVCPEHSKASEYLLIPVCKEDHYSLAVMHYNKEDKIATCFYIGSLHGSLEEFKPALLQIFKNVFKKIAPISQKRQLKFEDISGDFEKQTDNINSAAFVASNAIDFLDSRKDNLDTRFNWIMNGDQRRKWARDFTLKLFGTSEKELAITKNTANLGVEMPAMEIENMEIEKQAAVQMVENFETRAAIQAVNREINQVPNQAVEQMQVVDPAENGVENMEVELPCENLTGKTLDLKMVLGDKYEALYYKLSGIEPMMPIDQIPGIDTNPNIAGDVITFALADYIRQDDRPIGLYYVGFTIKNDAMLKDRSPMQFLIVYPRAACDYLIVPIYRRGYYTLAIMHYNREANVATCFFCDSLRWPCDELGPDLLNIYEKVFKKIARISEQTNISFVDISTSSMAQVDSVNCAAFVASNAVDFLDSRKNNLVPPFNWNLTGGERREWAKNLMLKLFNTTEREIRAEIKRYAEETETRIAINAVEEFERRMAPVESSVPVDAPHSGLPAAPVEHMEIERPLRVIKDFLVSKDALGQKYETHFNKNARIDPSFNCREIPGIDPNLNIVGDCITFVLYDYIRKDDRPIGLINVNYHDPHIRQRYGSNPMDYLVVRPPGLCDFLVVPFWSGETGQRDLDKVSGHYTVAIMHYDRQKNTSTCYYVDSFHGSFQPFKDEIINIYNKVFKTISGVPKRLKLHIRNIGKDSVRQTDVINCAAFAATNAIDFLDSRKNNSNRFFNWTKSGNGRRAWVKRLLLKMFGATEREIRARIGGDEAQYRDDTVEAAIQQVNDLLRREANQTANREDDPEQENVRRVEEYIRQEPEQAANQPPVFQAPIRVPNKQMTQKQLKRQLAAQIIDAEDSIKKSIVVYQDTGATAEKRLDWLNDLWEQFDLGLVDGPARGEEPVIDPWANGDVARDFEDADVFNPPREQEDDGAVTQPPQSQFLDQTQFPEQTKYSVGSQFFEQIRTAPVITPRSQWPPQEPSAWGTQKDERTQRRERRSEAKPVIKNKTKIAPPPTNFPNADEPERGPGRPPMANAALISERIQPEEIDIGPMQYECPNCKALLFNKENSSKCCAYGRVVMKPLPPYPEWINLLLDRGEYYRKHFYDKQKRFVNWFEKHWKSFNNILGVAGSVTYNYKDSGVKHQAPVKLVNGNIDFNLCHIESTDPNAPLVFAQMFTVDIEEKDDLLKHLYQNPFYTRIKGKGDARDNLFWRFYKYIKEVNPVAKGFRLFIDQIHKLKEHGIRQFIVQYVEEKDVPKEMREPDLHERQKNVPQFAETAVVFQPISKNCPVPNTIKGVWLWPQKGKPKIYIPHLPQLITIMNPLVCPHGELLFESKLPLKIIDNDDYEDYSDDESDLEELNPLEKAMNDNRPTGDEVPFYQFDDLVNKYDRDNHRFDDMDAGCNKTRKRLYASIREQILYRMQHRASDNGIHHLWNWGVLGFLIVITIHFMIVQREFDYYADKIESREVSCLYVLNQYQELLKKKQMTCELGYVRRAPRYHKLSWQYQQRKYADAMAISREYGSPTFFLTLTGNQQWSRYLEACELAGTDPKKSPFIMDRVFNLKLREMMHLLTGGATGKGILGECVAYVNSIEFQKRGNPHAHILLWVKNAKETAHYVDTHISARMPDPKVDPELYDKASRYMLHLCNTDSVCRNKNVEGSPCKQYYPQKEYTATQVGRGIVKYRRIYEENGGFTIVKYNRVCDDRYVVPYNPYVLHAWNGHANVEYVVSNGTPGYAIKYVLKGGSKVFVEILDKGITGNKYVNIKKEGKLDVDEGKYQFSLSYISIEEAIMNLLSFGPFFLSHTIVWIAVHLPEDITMTVKDGESIKNLHGRMKRRIYATKDCYSRLTAWFKYNRDHPNDDFIKNLIYTQFFKYFNFDKKTFQIKPYVRNSKRIVEMYEVPVKNRQKLALRAILLNKPYIKSFEDAATHNGVCHRNGEVFDFNAAAQAMGLISSGLLWKYALDLRKGVKINRFISLFAQSLADGQFPVAMAPELWEEYKDNMIPPLGKRADLANMEEIRKTKEQIALRILETRLKAMGKSLNELGLGHLVDLSVNVVPEYNPDHHGEDAAEFLEGNFENRNINQNIPFVQLGPEQQNAFNKIIDALTEAEAQKTVTDPKMLFVHGAGGTGKTTLYTQLNRWCKENGKNVITTATTGVAASLLPGGTTFHSRFFIPIDDRIHESPRMNFECQQALALRECALLLVDEASQLNKDVFNYAMKTLESVRTPGNEVKSRLVIVFGGDFRQLLPVLQDGSLDECFNYSIVDKYKEGEIDFLTLTYNHRTDRDEVVFREHLMNIGRGEGYEEKIDNYRTRVKLLNGIKKARSVQALVDAVFPNTDINNYKSWVMSAIVAPFNSAVREINSKMLDKLKGNRKIYKAVNTADDNADLTNKEIVDAMQESMAQVDEPGLQKQLLILKVGAKVIINKNINQRFRLCNGTPGIVTQMDDHVITIRRIEPNGELGEEIDIVRTNTKRRANAKDKKMLGFTRCQFPLELAFGMTIHKAQGQTLNKLGIYLNAPVFSPGQLYVALSRVRRASDIIVYNPDQSDIIENVTHPNVTKILNELENPNGNQVIVEEDNQLNVEEEIVEI